MIIYNDKRDYPESEQFDEIELQAQIDAKEEYEESKRLDTNE